MEKRRWTARWAAKSLSTILITLALSLAANSASAAVIERVVAVVNDRAILMTELRQRARPHLLEIQAKMPTEAQRAAAESEVLRQMLHRMIDELLEAQAAAKMRVRVDAGEVEKAIVQLARSQDMSVTQLLAEVAKSGMTPLEYRAEIRRQLLEAKLLDERLKRQVRVTEDDMRNLFERIRREERRSLAYAPQWIVVQIPADADAAERSRRRAYADWLSEQGRSGKDFAELARRYSDDTATKQRGGSLGMRRPGELEAVIERVAFALDIGEVSAPFRFADAFVVMRIQEREPSRLGSFENARDQLANRVYSEKLETVKRRWLDNLKRSVHIDIRL
ncbi:MAG: peptidyl-prolyl cis-trans isomerase SurA [Polyangiaceae bacterium]|nr:peptidyl-prolyl cis-trans isomerase SurA [Polyangiaceae bacterium]